MAKGHKGGSRRSYQRRLKALKFKREACQIKTNQVEDDKTDYSYFWKELANLYREVNGVDPPTE